MTLAPTLAGNTATLRRRAPFRLVRGAALDAAVFAAATLICAAFFFQGGLEALLGAGIASALSERRMGGWRAAFSGAFAGLWAGALFAGFFHGAAVSVLQTLF